MGAEVATVAGAPLLALPDEEHAHEPRDRGVGREDANALDEGLEEGAPAPLQRALGDGNAEDIELPVTARHLEGILTFAGYLRCSLEGSMFSSARALTPLDAAAGRAVFAVAADVSWLQGRSLFGGLQAAWLAGAGAALVPPERTLRTLHAQLLAPAPPGEAAVTAEIVRAGSRLTTVRASLTSGGDTVAVALMSFGRGWENGMALPGEVAPPLPPAAALAPLPGAPGIPAFLAHVDLRFSGTSLPYAGGNAEVAGLARFLDGGAWDAVQAVGLFDVFPPTPVMAATGVAPAATADLTLDLTGVLPDDPGAFVAIVGRATGGRDGLISQQSGMWTEDGRSMGRMRQLVAVVPPR